MNNKKNKLKPTRKNYQYDDSLVLSLETKTFPIGEEGNKKFVPYKAWYISERHTGKPMYMGNFKDAIHMFMSARHYSIMQAKRSLKKQKEQKETTP